MKYRARANREVRELTPSEVTALVPWLYEPIEDEEAPVALEPERDSALLVPEAPIETVVTQQARTRRRRA